MNKTPIHLDRLARGLAAEGVVLTRGRLLAVAAAAFGCRNVHELSSLDGEGGLDPLAAEDLGSQYVLHVGQMQFLRDPSGYIYAVQPDMLERQGRERGWHIAPFGGVACTRTQKADVVTPQVHAPTGSHAPEVPYMLTDSGCEHVGGREGDYVALGRDFGSFENDFHPLDAEEMRYVADDVVAAVDESAEVRIGYSAMYRGIKHLAPTAEFRYDDGEDGDVVRESSANALARARSFQTQVLRSLKEIGGDAILTRDSGDVYGDPAHTVMLLVPFAAAMSSGSPEAWKAKLAELIKIQPSSEERPDVRVEGSEYAVVLDYIGEGEDGDYDPADPDDQPLYRLEVQRLVDGEWEYVEDTSYCTQINADISPLRAEAAARYLLDRVEVDGGPYLKRLCEELSWTDIAAVEAHGG